MCLQSWNVKCQFFRLPAAPPKWKCWQVLAIMERHMSNFQASCSAPKMEVLTSACNHGTSYVKFSSLLQRPQNGSVDMCLQSWNVICQFFRLAVEPPKWKCWQVPPIMERHMSNFQACCSAPKMELLTCAYNHGTSNVNFSGFLQRPQNGSVDKCLQSWNVKCQFFRLPAAPPKWKCWQVLAIMDRHMSNFQACCSAPKMEVLTSACNHGTSYVNVSGLL